MSRAARILIILAFSPITLLAQKTEPPNPAVIEGILKSDLKNMVVAQEMFYANHARYAKSLSELVHADMYSPSDEVTIVVIL
jgi:hypothetical protein